MIAVAPLLIALAGLASSASAHIAFWHNSMYGFNVTDQTFSYDNRPQVPLYDMTFEQWWLHGHIDYPPNDGDVFELPAGGTVNSELSCDKGATSWYASSQGGDVGYGSNSPCPGAQTTAFHTNNEDDVKGCALAIAYKSDVNDLQPDDFVVFSVNHTCVWYLNTAFNIPQLPACPDGGCHCTFNWIHSIDSGSEQIYQNAFKCKVTGNVGSQALGTPLVPRRCGTDASESDASVASPGNCTIGAKTPMYWYQKEGNNMFEDTYHAPYYNGLYGFNDGAQTDIFEDGVIASLASFTVSSATSTSKAAASQAAAATTTAVQQTTKVAVALSAAISSSSSEHSSSTPASTSSSAATTQACKRRASKKRDLAKKHVRQLSGLHH